MKLKIIFTAILSIFIGFVSAMGQPQSVMKSYNFSTALEEAKKGNNAEAIDFLKKEVTDNPNNGYAFFTMAVLQADGEDKGFVSGKIPGYRCHRLQCENSWQKCFLVA